MIWPAHCPPLPAYASGAPRVTGHRMGRFDGLNGNRSFAGGTFPSVTKNRNIPSLEPPGIRIFLYEPMPGSPTPRVITAFPPE